MPGKRGVYSFILFTYTLLASATTGPVALNKTRVPVSNHASLTARRLPIEDPAKTRSCESAIQVPEGDYELLSNGSIFVAEDNAMFEPTAFNGVSNGVLSLCLVEDSTEEPQGTTLDPNDVETCGDFFEYEPQDFKKLDNGSVVLFGELLQEGHYKFEGGNLYTCVLEYGDDFNFTDEQVQFGYYGSYFEDKVLILIGKIGAGISVACLTAHLVIFCLVPTLRNLPGYNLTCFSLSLLVAYSFVLIGQIPEVLGASCIASAILQQNFFLAAFFWMNAMSFDVWRTLRLATKNLVIMSSSVKSKRFCYYCLYSWGLSFAITAASVICDNVDSVPRNLKPEYGRHDICWINNMWAKGIFFMFPAFMLFVVNAVFYGLSAKILFSNTMKVTGDDRKTVRSNLVLYAKIAVIMGLTWLLSLVAAYTMWRPLWYVFDVLNSIQGVFVFVLFSCSRKVWRYLQNKAPECESNSKDSNGSKGTNSTGTKSETQCTSPRNSDIIVMTTL